MTYHSKNSTFIPFNGVLKNIHETLGSVLPAGGL